MYLRTFVRAFYYGYRMVSFASSAASVLPPFPNPIIMSSYVFIIYFFSCFNTFFALSDNTTIAPARIAISLMTKRPAPDSKGNPCSPLPKSGTQTSGVVTRKESVPMVMITAKTAPINPIFGKKMPRKVRDAYRHNKYT